MVSGDCEDLLRQLALWCGQRFRGRPDGPHDVLLRVDAALGTEHCDARYCERIIIRGCRDVPDRSGPSRRVVSPDDVSQALLRDGSDESRRPARVQHYYGCAAIGVAQDEAGALVCRFEWDPRRVESADPTVGPNGIVILDRP